MSETEGGQSINVVTKGGPIESPQAKAAAANYKEIVSRVKGKPESLNERLTRLKEKDRASKMADTMPLQDLLTEADNEERIFGKNSPRALALRNEVSRRRQGL